MATAHAEEKHQADLSDDASETESNLGLILDTTPAYTPTAAAQSLKVRPDTPICPYSRPVEEIREEEYPHMSNGVYLDHSGTTIYARSLITRVAHKLTTNLYGNPHSANEPAHHSGSMVDNVRLQALHFLGADPAHFDLIFVANATAAIKLVGDAFRDLAEQTPGKRFWYGYHTEAHTSLVGVRELAGRENHVCFRTDASVSSWLTPTTPLSPQGLGLFAYPGQSNLTGRRLPLTWPSLVRSAPHLRANTYTLLDAAALAVTAPLASAFSDPAAAPDFTCLSFHKVFGYPDLGALVVRRASGHILTLRRYFGGGTVHMVSTGPNAWHLSKGVPAAPDGDVPLHDALEDGTLPFHSILALGEAIDVHRELFGGMDAVGRHTAALARRMHDGITGLRHPSGRAACKVYADGEAFGDPAQQGATVAFNVVRADGTFVSYAEVERRANERGVYVRSGGVCCPGGVFSALGYEDWQMGRARSAGHHCGNERIGVIHDLPTGIVRASLGAMSTAREVDVLVAFLEDEFIKGDAGGAERWSADSGKAFVEADMREALRG
ncbi:pyridoxal phosphate-dependent transferase [Schizothecium vesticola]|uniref:Pyridoxal phosphate-dependent transferase n=1 Tax=Schizothecium vesticola TaxID=314040 RepID=A0AA40EVA4_9PEZI|nr:pyridoxal phosphate-dependent transferase [Schizothecium vesticola]